MHIHVSKVPCGTVPSHLAIVHTSAAPSSRAAAVCRRVHRAGSLDTWDPQPISYNRHSCCFQSGQGPQPCGSFGVSLVTQVSLDRWPRFAQQAAEWRGPVSVAAYIPAPYGTPAAAAGLDVLEQLFYSYCQDHPHQAVTVSTLFAIHHAAEGFSALPPGCPPPTSPTSLTYDKLYPINALRNLALTAAATSHALLVDADFIPSLGLQQQLLQHFADLAAARRASEVPRTHSASTTTASGTDKPSTQQLSEGAAPAGVGTSGGTQQGSSWSKEKMFVVVPAFQLQLVAGGVVEDKQQLQVPRTKEQLAQAVAAGQVKPFHCGVFPQPTPSVDYAAWLHADHPLQLQYHEYWEPFGAGPIASMPLYDERFRGYGLNKQQHTRHLEALGFEFQALPGGFVVTAPHPRTGTWRGANGTRQDQDHLERIQQLYARFMADSLQGSPGAG